MTDYVPFSLCSIDGEGGGDTGGAGGGPSGIGGAADLIGAGTTTTDTTTTTTDTTTAAADAEWLKQFSAEGGDADNPSPRDWLTAKGFKTPDDLVKSYREAEAAIRNGGKFTVPGENAKPEEIAAYHRAIGVPEKVDGYEVNLPEGAEIDAGFLDPMRERALKAGVPAKAFQELADGYVAWQQDQINTMKTNEDTDAGEWIKAQGAQKDARMADVAKAMKTLGLDAADVAGIQLGLAQVHKQPGSARTLDLLAKLGAGMAEDALIGGGKGRFGVTGAEAQAEIDRLIVDKDFQTKLGAKEPGAVARWNRLNEAVAAARDAENARATAA